MDRPGFLGGFSPEPGFARVQGIYGAGILLELGPAPGHPSARLPALYIYFQQFLNLSPIWPRSASVGGSAVSGGRGGPTQT